MATIYVRSTDGNNADNANGKGNDNGINKNTYAYMHIFIQLCVHEIYG